ncbi:MAG: S-layer homology domain-containing protein [Clostridia bacterium]|nr:S-layer homology domain-containing protein [Clostridia bacterium]
MKTKFRLLSAVLAVLMIITVITVPLSAESDPFDDVKSSWYYDAVNYVYENSLMTGTGGGKFSPAANVTRAQMVQILFNMEGIDAEDYKGKTGFSDSDNAWYSPAVKWAKESGVTSGITETTFAPNKQMTRQELTQFMRAYSQFKGFTTDGSKSLEGFEDSGKVAAWAVPAIKWAVAEGVISGSEKDGKLYLNPTSTARRNELAVIIMNYHSGFYAQPVMCFAAMSDVHIGDKNTEESMRRTLRYINSYGEMDAFMFSGDLTNTTANTVNASQIVEFDRILGEEVNYDTSVVYSLGPSHDLPYAASGLECRALFNENLNDKYFTYDITPDDMAALGVRHSIIDGYHFFSIDHEGAGFYDEAMVWLVAEVEKAVAEDPDEPFFVSTHVPDMPHVNALLASYPQAVCFTGHVHNSVAREDSIRQDNGYTNIHLGGMNYYRVDGYNRFNDNPFLDLGNIYEFAQAVYVEVYADNTVKLQRLDGYNSATIGEAWEISSETFGRYTDIRKSEPLCSFDEDAKLEIVCTDDTSLKVSFDAAKPGAAGPAQYYMVEWLMPVYGNYEVVEHFEISSQEVFFNGRTIPDLYYSYTFESDTFEDFAVRVTAFDCWGQSVNSLVYGLEGEEFGDINVTIE